MKDPTILCPDCTLPGRRIRGMAGYRCTDQKCLKQGVIIATDGQVNSLRAYLKQEADHDLFEWAKSQQK